MRRRARQDANASQVVQALRSCGWCWFDTSRLGEGFPDGLAVRRGQIVPVEIKDGSKPPSRRLLTMAEIKVCDAFDRAGVRVRILKSVEEALAL